LKSATALRPTLGALLSVLLTGCGGGGGGGGTSSSPSTPADASSSNITTTTTPPSSATISGLVDNSSGTALSGYQVVYDFGTASALTATTDSSGRFTLTVPAGEITGSDTLTLKDTLGATAASQSVTLVAGQTASVTFTPADAAPPPPALLPPP
jgi:hypothetical protein